MASAALPSRRLAAVVPLRVWEEVAQTLTRHRRAGLWHLTTEDVLRWATIERLVANGVEPARLRSEWIIPGQRGKVDLVVDDPPTAAIEFKFPRDSRTGVSADTMTLGELLKDVYRVGALRQVPERWFVLLVGERLARYLEARTDCRWVLDVGGQLKFAPEGFALLPATASAGLDVYRDATVEAHCVRCSVIEGHRLLAYLVA
jgi:hypothetical protein